MGEQMIEQMGQEQRGGPENLKPGDHIHFMGICGTAMASLAGLLKERGFKVTGSDQNIYPPMSHFLQDQGIEIMEGYGAENLNPAPHFVVVGNVISKSFEEAQALLKSSIPYASLSETLRDLVIEGRHSMVVTGTHGKTTTTAMLAWLCEKEGLSPGFLVGGLPGNFKRSFQQPGGDHWVIEGDEYDTAFFAKRPKFLYYKPRTVILSSIEFDHGDIYENLESILKAFGDLLKMIPEKEGLLIHNAEDENIKKVLPLFSGTKRSYGIHGGDWTAGHIQFLRSGLEFDVYYGGRKEERLFVPMFGSYNVGNALAVFALARELGFSSDLKESFKSFRGVKRRQELIGEPGGIQVIEDFAHHPTAVKATIESFQMRKGKGKLFVVFEPCSNTSRTARFQEDYAEALALGDEVFVSQAFRPPPSHKGLNVEAMVKKMGPKAHGFSKVEEPIALIKEKAKPKDTVLIMSNGGFQGIYAKILKALAG